MYKKIETAKTATLNSGEAIRPLATMADEHGGIAHIWEDDRCLCLGLERNPFANCPGDTGPQVTPTSHIFREALEAMANIAHIAGVAAPVKKATCSIQYVGRRPSQKDPKYNTGVWTTGQVKPVPLDVAVNLLREFPGVFVKGSVATIEDLKTISADVVSGHYISADNGGSIVPDDVGEDKDEKDEKEEADKKENDEEEKLQQARDMVAAMEIEQLKQFAFTNFGQKIHHAAGLATARQKVTMLIDQYGLP